jgi:hypothetical protein
MVFCVAGGCAAQGASTTAGPSPQLTWANPVAKLQLGIVPAGTKIIALSIGSVRNPEREPVRVQVSIADPAADTFPVTIRTVGPIPSDQSGRYTIRVPNHIVRTQTNLLEPGARRVLIVALISSVYQPRSALFVLKELGAEWIAEPK